MTFGHYLAVRYTRITHTHIAQSTNTSSTSHTHTYTHTPSTLWAYHVQERQILELAAKRRGLMRVRKVHVGAVIVDAVPEMQRRHHVHQRPQAGDQGGSATGGDAAAVAARAAAIGHDAVAVADVERLAVRGNVLAVRNLATHDAIDRYQTPTLTSQAICCDWTMMRCVYRSTCGEQSTRDTLSSLYFIICMTVQLFFRPVDAVFLPYGVCRMMLL